MDKMQYDFRGGTPPLTLLWWRWSHIIVKKFNNFIFVKSDLEPGIYKVVCCLASVWGEGPVTPS